MPSFFTVHDIKHDTAQRAAFDRWYAEEHLPDAAKSFGAEKAWRFWSESDPSVHQATYQFADRAALDHGTRADNMTWLVAAFDQAWPALTRRREIMTLAEEWRAEEASVIPGRDQQRVNARLRRAMVESP